MATTGTRNTSITFGGFPISVSMKKVNGSRDLKTEIVDETGQKVSGGGGGWGGGGSRKPGEGQSRAVRITETEVVRLPQERLEAIEATSKETWQDMQVLEVIDYREVPTERIIGGYQLQPAHGSVRTLALLARALRETGGVAVVKWVSTTREKLGVIRLRGRRGQQWLLLSELSFANDFMDADEDALAINAHIDDLDPRELGVAMNLVDAYARDGEKKIETASDEAVDARIALFEEIREQQVQDQLAAAATELAEREDAENVVAINSRKAA